jgi:GLPGLI family protein
MKLINLLFFLIICFKINSQKQLEITYDHFISNEKITKSKTPKQLKDVNYKLIINNNLSKFSLIEQMESSDQKRNRRVIAAIGGTEIFYIDIENKRKIREIHFDEKIFKIVDTKKQNFKLTKETKFISNYKCYKAIIYDSIFIKELNRFHNYSYIAWYSPEIPVNHGPFGFSGLPGLILEFERFGHHIVANKILIVKDNTLT